MPKKSIIDGVKTDIEEKLAGNICMYLALHYFGKLAHTDDPKQLEEIITKSKVGTLQFKRKFKKRKIIYAGRQTDI